MSGGLKGVLVEHLRVSYSEGGASRFRKGAERSLSVGRLVSNAATGHSSSALMCLVILVLKLLVVCASVIWNSTTKTSSNPQKHDSKTKPVVWNSTKETRALWYQTPGHDRRQVAAVLGAPSGKRTGANLRQDVYPSGLPVSLGWLVRKHGLCPATRVFCEVKNV